MVPRRVDARTAPSVLDKGIYLQSDIVMICDSSDESRHSCEHCAPTALSMRAPLRPIQCICVCVYIYMHVSTYMYVHMYVCMYTHTYTYMYTYMYIYIYIHMYAYTFNHVNGRPPTLPTSKPPAALEAARLPPAPRGTPSMKRPARSSSVKLERNQILKRTRARHMYTYMNIHITCVYI